MASFEYGDRAIYNGHKGKIVSVWFNKNGDKITRIRFDDASLMPREMEVPEVHLRPDTEENDWYGGYYGKRTYGPVERVCPKCGKDWTKREHPIFGKKKIWYDCDKCGTKREDYVK